MTMNLLPNEIKLIELFRALPKDAAHEVVDFAAFKASRTASWSYDDPASCAAAIERMANDPEILREVAAIEREFAPTLSDGLERYE